MLWLVIAFDATFFNVLAPLLPKFVDALRLSKLDAGLLVGAFAAGTVAGTLPGMILLLRRGYKVSVLCGIGTLAAACVGMALGTTFLALSAARFLQGLGSGILWTGSLGWVVAAAGSRRGSAIGGLLGAGVAGQLFGPAFGVLAWLISTRLVFLALAGVGGVLCLGTSLTSPPPRETEQRAAPRPAAVSPRRGIAAGLWLIALPALLSGALGVIAPLRLHDAGATVPLIGAVWLAAACAGVVVSPALGWWSDRDRSRPLRAALLSSALLSAALLAAVAYRPQAWPLAAVTAAAAISYGALWSPGMAILSEQAELGGMRLHVASALQSLWAPGNVVGAIVVGGVVAQWLGDAAAFALLAGLCLVTLSASYLVHGARPLAR
jgi:MFS family permease